MLNPIVILFGSLSIGITFIVGFFVGMWLTRHNTTVIEKHLPPEIVKVPEIRLVEKLAPPPAAPAAPQQPARPAAMFTMVGDNRTPTQRVEEAKMGELLDNMTPLPQPPGVSVMPGNVVQPGVPE